LQQIHTLLKNTYYRGVKGVKKRGFIYFNSEKIIDVGEEARPEYDFSELVIDYGFKAYAMHGYSVVASLTNYPFRGIGRIDLTIYSRDELEKIVHAALYELIMNGVSLPATIIRDENEVEAIINVLKRNNIKAIIFAEEGIISKYKGLYSISICGEKLIYEGKIIGDTKKAICKPQTINNECLFLDISDMYTYNLSLIMNFSIYSSDFKQETVIDLLTKPYKVLGIDNGVIEINGRPDIIVYDLREPYNIVPKQHIELVIFRGYPPTQVFIDGDTFFDHGESLVLSKPNIDFILEK
jgi:hypothetical protein